MRNKPAVFFTSRALRIFPALLLAIPLMALVFGPLVSDLKFRDYFSSPETWRFLGTILVFPLNPTLPGVFGGAPLVAQLYSLTAELGFYIFVGLLARWTHYGKLLAFLLSLVFSVFIHFDYSTLSFSSLISAQTGQMVLFTFPLRLGLVCVFYLLAGSAIALVAPTTKLLARCTPLLLAIWLVALFANDRRVYDVTEMILFPLIIVGIGSAKHIVIPLPKTLGDISYGVYIYHFFIAELVRSWNIQTSHYGYLIALSIILSMLVAWISFHAIEKRALSMKKSKLRSAVGNAPVTEHPAVVRNDAQKPV